MAVPAPVSVSISPEPTDDELAAILAAYRELWPEPALEASERARVSRRWKFQGRWWSDQAGQRGGASAW